MSGRAIERTHHVGRRTIMAWNSYSYGQGQSTVAGLDLGIQRLSPPLLPSDRARPACASRWPPTDARLFTERVFPGVPEVTVAARDRGTGRPTKRERRSTGKLPGRPAGRPGFICTGTA